MVGYKEYPKSKRPGTPPPIPKSAKQLELKVKIIDERGKANDIKRFSKKSI